MNDPPKRDVMLFAEALQLSPAERCAYLACACGADKELRQRVEQLLEAHDQAGDFLEQPPPEAESVAEAPIGEKPGDRIGRYKLLQQIGEGGGGIAYIQEQHWPVLRR